MFLSVFMCFFLFHHEKIKRADMFMIKCWRMIEKNEKCNSLLFFLGNDGKIIKNVSNSYYSFFQTTIYS